MGGSNGIYKKKSKEIRVCTDFSTGLNAALKDYHYPLPTPEDVFNKLNEKKKRKFTNPLMIDQKRKNINSAFTK